MPSSRLSLAELRRLPQLELVATMQCSGNRRGDMNKVQKSSGTSWGQGAISTARWSGPRLRDVVKMCGLQDPDLDPRLLERKVRGI